MKIPIKLMIKALDKMNNTIMPEDQHKCEIPMMYIDGDKMHVWYFYFEKIGDDWCLTELVQSVEK